MFNQPLFTQPQPTVSSMRLTPFVAARSSVAAGFCFRPPPAQGGALIIGNGAQGAPLLHGGTSWNSPKN